jgi:hypothetical protein
MVFQSLLIALFLTASIGQTSVPNPNPTVEISSNNSKFPCVLDNGNISITFPGEFKQTVKEKENATTTKASCTLDGLTYFIGWTLHRIEMTEHEKMAEVSLTEFNRAAGGEIIEEKAYKYKKHIGRSAKIQIGDKGFALYKVVLIGQNQFQLVVASNDDNFGSTSKKFFKSFKYKGK